MPLGRAAEGKLPITRAFQEFKSAQGATAGMQGWRQGAIQVGNRLHLGNHRSGLQQSDT